MSKLSRLKLDRLSPRKAHLLHPDVFRASRQRLRWSVEQAAEFLWVSARTVRYWESGRYRVPYSAVRLLRLAAGSAVSAAGWEGWQFGADGTLWSPTGRAFRASELEYLSFTFLKARAWDRESTRTLREKLFGQSRLLADGAK